MIKKSFKEALKKNKKKKALEKTRLLNNNSFLYLIY